MVHRDRIEIQALLLADPEEMGPNLGPDVPDYLRHGR